MSEAGCVTDSGLNDQARRALARWVEAHGEAISAEPPPGRPFPFGFLDDENSRRFLHGQYERAKRGSTRATTIRCGRPRRTGIPQAAVTDALPDLMTRKHRLKPLYVAARLPREAAGMGAPWTDAWLLRAFLERRPEQADNVLAVTEAFTAGTGVIDDEVPWFGRTVAAVIAWDPEDFPGDEDGPLGARLRDFDAAAARSVQVRVELPADVFPHPAERLAEFLRDAHAPVTLSRRGDTATFTAAGKALKKRLLLAGTCRSAAAGAVLELSIGTRPFLGEWLKSFGRPEAVRGGAGGDRRAV